MEKYQTLFSNIEISGLTLKNRIVAAPMTLNWAENDGHIGKRHEDYYKSLAYGGVGLIITEGASVSKEHRSPNSLSLSIYNDTFSNDLKRITKEVHKHNAAIFLQLYDGLHDRGPGDLINDEIKKIRMNFVKAALRAQASGFDGIEIHMVHHGTISDFISKKTNIRTDHYGFNVEGRTRLAVEILTEIKCNCGYSFPVSCRISGDEFMFGGNTTKDAVAVAKTLESGGTDIISISAGGRLRKKPKLYNGKLPQEYSYWRAWPTSEWPDAANSYLGEEFKKSLNIPIMIAGKIGDPNVAESIIKAQKGDLVALGRALIADPYLVNKIREDKWNDAKKCMYCMYCRRKVWEGHPIKCILWEGNNEPFYNFL